MKFPVVSHRDYEIPLRPGHSFPMTRFGFLRRALVERGFVAEGGFIEPAEAGEAQLRLAHEAGYVSRALSLTLSEAEMRRIGLPLSPALIRRARLSAAGTLLTARLALEYGVASNAAGGGHHSGPDAGAGYCVFNDVAVAARTLLAEGVIGRAGVLDLDVHQGDGTARIFENDPRVFTLSIHGEKNFPARKARSDLDIALPDGAGDEAYMEALETALAALSRERLDILFFIAGVDVVEWDRLGRLSLSLAGLRARDARVLRWARGRGLALASVLGGGYGEDPAEIAARNLVFFEEREKMEAYTA